MDRKPSITNSAYGECRCCKEKGIHKDLSTEHYSDGKREAYSDIFIECFNLFLCSDTRLSSLICITCIKQLTDAYNFKMRVMALETEMINAFTINQGGSGAVFVSSIQHIKEEIKVTVKQEWLMEDDLSVDLMPDNDTPTGESEFDEDQLLSRFPRSELKALPTRSDLKAMCPGYLLHLEELKGQIITASMVQDLQMKPVPRKQSKKRQPLKSPSSVKKKERKCATPMSEKTAQADNISTLLENSNLTAFMSKFKNGFPCFYCKSIFEKFEDLRQHQASHSKENIHKLILKRYRKGRPDSLVVYVDVTNLICTLCGVKISNLIDLKSHLTQSHHKIFHNDYTDRVIPYKMSDAYLCQVCGFNFETFGAIERHMNTHFRNYVCEICGAGFITKHRLKIHTYNLHSSLQGTFPCDVCKKTFPTHRKYKIHYDFVHKMAKKLKCPKCPAKFLYYYVRQKHLFDAHGETPVLYKCNVCEKEFKRRYALSIHIKKEHLNQGDFNCDVCDYSCFSSNELKVHMLKKHENKCTEKSVKVTVQNVGGQ